MTPEQIRELPASWYANQPIPQRLLVDLGRDLRLIKRGGKVPRHIEVTVRASNPQSRRTLVEQAHVRATSRLLRF